MRRTPKVGYHRRMLVPSARIAVIAPSGIYDPARLALGIDLLSSWGYRPRLLPGAAATWRYLAGEDHVRGRDLADALTGDWDAVWMARGGYGLSRLLPSLPWAQLRGRPFFGFSDGTALLNPLADLGQPAVHAPVLHSLADTCDEATREHLRALLRGEGAEVSGQVWVAGSATGPLRGGNLCVLASLCGTPWQPKFEGCIVLLEEVGEGPYRVDRMLTQLISSGSLDGAAAFVIGQMVGCHPVKGADYTVQDVLMERLEGRGVPVLGELPVGHGAENRALPFVNAELSGGRLRVGAARVVT